MLKLLFMNIFPLSSLAFNVIMAAPTQIITNMVPNIVSASLLAEKLKVLGFKNKLISF